MIKPAVSVYCTTCGKRKVPIGRDIPLGHEDSWCRGNTPNEMGCPGYRQEPYPDCRWPGEESCGPYCTAGVANPVWSLLAGIGAKE